MLHDKHKTIERKEVLNDERPPSSDLKHTSSPENVCKNTGQRLKSVSASGSTCICPACGTTALHRPGIPCVDSKCPACGAPMSRKF